MWHRRHVGVSRITLHLKKEPSKSVYHTHSHFTSMTQRITKYLFAFTLGLSTISVAAPVGNAVSRELTALRRNHEDGLDRLLSKYLKEKNLSAVSSICSEIKSIRREPPKVETGTPPVGRWRWSADSNVVISSSGLATWNDCNYGIWKWLNESERKMEIRWDNGFTDTLTISADGRKFHIINNYDDKFMADKVDAGN